MSIDYKKLVSYHCRVNHKKSSELLKNIIQSNICDYAYLYVYDFSFQYGRLPNLKWLVKLHHLIPNYLYLEEFKHICKGGHYNVAKWLMQQKPNLLSYFSISEYVVLCLTNGFLNMANLLINMSPYQMYFHKIYDDIDKCICKNVKILPWLKNIDPACIVYKCKGNLFKNVCMHGKLNIVKCVFDEEPEIILENNFDNIFAVTCENGHIEVAEWLLTVKPNIDILCNNDYAFIFSCSNGHLDMAKWLLDLNSDINITNENNYAFINSCINDHIHMAKWLLDLDPNIIKSVNTQTLVFSCLKNGSINAIKWLTSIKETSAITINFTIDCVKNICSKNEYNNIIWLLQYCKNKNDESYIFLLFCECDNIDVAKWLYDANPHFKKILSTTLIKMCEHGHFDIFKWLFTLLKTETADINYESLFIKAYGHKHYNICDHIFDYNYLFDEDCIDKLFTEACKKSSFNKSINHVVYLMNKFPTRYDINWNKININTIIYDYKIITTDEMCCICYCNLSSLELKCRHSYCSNCIFNLNPKVCPLCNFNFTKKIE